MHVILNKLASCRVAIKVASVKLMVKWQSVMTCGS